MRFRRDREGAGSHHRRGRGAIDKIAATIGWHPKVGPDGILADVIAYTRASQAPRPT